MAVAVPVNNHEQCLEFDFPLTVENFPNFLGEGGETIVSEDFGGKTDLFGVTWKINALAYRRPHVRRGSKYVSLYLRIFVDPKNACQAVSSKFKVLQLIEMGAEWEAIKADTRGQICPGRNGGAFEKYIYFKVRSHFPNDNLILRFKGKAFIKFNQFEPEERRQDPNCIMANTMKKMFHEGTGHDVVIKAGNNEFKGHKCVLMVRSEYFRAMFEIGMKENEENFVDFGNQIKEDELTDLMEFLYLGSVSNLPNTCRGLLGIADMLGLPQLKHLCEELLSDSLNVDNAFEIAQFARERGATNLERKAHSILAVQL